jgi:hypothetical protein
MLLPILSPQSLDDAQKPLYDDMKQGIERYFRGFVNVQAVFSVEKLSRKRTPLMRSSKQSLPDIPQSEPHYEAPSSLYPSAPQAF